MLIGLALARRRQIVSDLAALRSVGQQARQFVNTPSSSRVLALARRAVASQKRTLVRAEGVEPSSHAWEARIIPIYYARATDNVPSAIVRPSTVKPAPADSHKACVAAQTPRLPDAYRGELTAASRCKPSHVDNYC